MQRQQTISQAMIDQYGQINGDNDIIHYDHAYALERGFRGTLLHGPHMTALAAELGARRHGKDWLYQGVLHTKWIGPVCPGDQFVATLEDSGELSAEAGGRTVLVGSARLRA